MEENKIKQVKQLIQEKESGVTEKKLEEIMDNIRVIMGNFKTVDLEIPETIEQVVMPSESIEPKFIDTDNIELVFDNVEALKKADLSLGQIVRTYGYYNKLDGGEARYVIVDNHTADEKCSFKLDNGLVAKLVMVNNTCNIKQFGAKGNDIDDDTEIIQYVFNYIGELGGGVIGFPKGEYKVTAQLNIKYSNISIIGNWGNKIKYYGVGTGTLLLVMGSTLNTECIHDIVLDGLKFDGTNQEFKGGATEDDMKTTSIKPLYRRGLTVIRPQNVYKMKIVNCQLIDFYGNGIAVDRSSHMVIEDNFLWDCSGNGFGHGMAGDCFGDGIGCWKSSHCSVKRNCVINTRTFLTHEVSCGRDVYGYPCGRSGLEFEYPVNIDVQGNPERWTPMHMRENVGGYNLLFEDNFVYGYTKGCHLENGVDCQVLNNTFVHNHIGFLDATGGNTIVSGNYFDPDGVKNSVQGGYDWYFTCGCAFTHFLGQWFDNAIIDGNTFVGDMTGIQIGRSKITIQNNIFRQTSGSCIGKRINWGSEITIQNNEFNYPKWDGKPCGFISLEGTNVKIIGNEFVCLDGVLGEFGCTLQENSIIAHNTFRNVTIGGRAEKFVDNEIIINNKDENRAKGSIGLFGLGGYKEVSGNNILVNGTSVSFGIGGKFINNKIKINNYITQPVLGIGEVKTPINFKGNEIYTDKPMKDTFMWVDGRINGKKRMIINIEDNYMDNYEPDFKWIRPYWTDSKYSNLKLTYKNNLPSKIGWEKSNMTPISGDYYYLGDKVQTSILGDTELICVEAGYYGVFEWNAETEYNFNEFVLDGENVYKCMSNKLKSDKKPSEDKDNWKDFGKTAKFEEIKK